MASDAGEGPVVVLLHGIASSAATFENLLPLIQPTHRCITIDLLGFGESPSPPDAQYTIEEHVASIRRTIRSLKLREPYTLIGHSLGALLAVRYAAIFPKELAHLVLVSPPIYLRPNELGDRRVRAQVGAYLKVYEFMRSNKDFTIAAVAQVVKLFALGKTLDINERNWNAFVLSLQHCIESQTTVSDIASVTAPIDIVYGSLDQFLAAGSMKIVERMRGVTMHRIDVSDHVMRPRLARAVAATVK